MDPAILAVRGHARVLAEAGFCAATIPPAEYVPPYFRFDRADRDDRAAGASATAAGTAAPAGTASPAASAGRSSTSLPIVPIANGQVVIEGFGTVWYPLNVPSPGWRMVEDFGTASPAGVVVYVDNGKQKGRKTTLFLVRPRKQRALSIFRFRLLNSITFTSITHRRIGSISI
jgi:hypothetical protein